jgi:NitT/TauT family transport system ATP-binding protein
VDVRGVTLPYRTRDQLVTATYRADFPMYQPDRFVLPGPSGCGTSTLLNSSMAPLEGEIRLKGQRITRPAPTG